MRALLPWPKPPGCHQSVCHFCDTLHVAEPLPEGTAAICKCCGAVLYQNRPASLARASAFSATSLILMVIVYRFPFLVMDAVTMRRSLDLPSAAMAYIRQGDAPLGIAMILFTMVAPLVLSGGLLYICGPLMFGRVAPGAIRIASWMNKTEPWNMVEVFLLGVLVSLLKLVKVADVHFGLGFWAFAALMVCMAAAVAGIDRDELWDRLEVAKR